MHPVHTNMVWLDLDSIGCSSETINELGKEEGLKLLGNRMVIHYQIYQNRDFVLPRLQRIFKTVMENKKFRVRPPGNTSQYTSKL